MEITEAPKSTSAEALNGVYVSGKTWNKNGKVSIYPSVIIISDKLYRGQITLSFEQLSLVLENAEALKAIAKHKPNIKAICRSNPDAVIPIANAILLATSATEAPDEND